VVLPRGGQGSAGVRPERPEAGRTAQGRAASAARPCLFSLSAGVPEAVNSGGAGAARLSGPCGGRRRKAGCSELRRGRLALGHWGSRLAYARRENEVQKPAQVEEEGLWRSCPDTH
jgi:hypothetical protein